MKPSLLSRIRELLNSLNSNKGKGNTRAIQIQLDGTGIFFQKFSHWKDESRKFRILFLKGDRLRVYALGSSITENNSK